MSETKPTVLFVCVHNAGRSQMAAALLKKKAGEAIEVLSAGSEPASELNPAVIEVMLEDGVDLTNETPKLLSTESVQAADVVITMGCGDACPFFPGKKYVDWKLEDPAGRPIDEVRIIKDIIASHVNLLTTELLGRSIDL